MRPLFCLFFLLKQALMLDKGLDPEKIKSCIIINGFNDESFRNCYGENFSKL